MDVTHLKKYIVEMYDVDQAARKNCDPNSLGIWNYMVYVIDHVHNADLKRIIKEHGYNFEDLGEETLEQFFMLVQHQDHDIEFQEECLKKCKFNGRQQAYLTDRIMAAEEGVQLYGTRHYREGDRLKLFPIRDEQNVDQRRIDIGLPPLADDDKDSFYDGK